MKDIKIDILSLKTFLIFCMSPFFALPLVIWGIYRRHQASFIYLAFFMGLMAYLTPPVGDLYRHTMNYFNYQNTDFSHFINDLRGDILLDFISYVLARLRIPYDFVRLFYVTISYLILNRIFNWYIRYPDIPYSKKEAFIRYIFVFSGLLFFNLTLGVRFTFAAMLFLLSLHLYINCDKKGTAVFYLLLSVMTHYSMIAYCLFVLVFMCAHFNKSLTIIILLAAAGLSNILMNIIEPYVTVTEFIGQGYLEDGKWGSGAGEYISPIKLLYYFICKIISCPILLFCLRIYDRKDKWQNVLVSFFFLLFLLWPLQTLSDRTAQILLIISPLFLIYSENRSCKRISGKYLTTLLLLWMFVYAGNIYGMDNPRALSRYRHTLLPVPVIFSQHYEQSWIMHNIDTDGLRRNATQKQ